MLIDILRHGEPVGGVRYRGTTDDALSETGWQQMADAVNSGTTSQSIENITIPWTHVVSSPLSRCADFAKQISEAHSLALSIEPRFAEIDFGDWEGLTSQQIMARDPERLSQYWSNPTDNTPPNGESLLHFKSRVISAWQDLLTQHSSSEKKQLLVITHGGTLRVILSHVLKMPNSSLFNFDVPHACLSRIQHQSNSQSQLLFHNGKLL